MALRDHTTLNPKELAADLRRDAAFWVEDTPIDRPCLVFKLSIAEALQLADRIDPPSDS